MSAIISMSLISRRARLEFCIFIRYLLILASEVNDKGAAEKCKKERRVCNEDGIILGAENNGCIYKY